MRAGCGLLRHRQAVAAPATRRALCVARCASRAVRLRAVRLRAAAAGARTAALVQRVVLLVFGQGGDDLLLGRPAIPSSGAEAANTELGCTLT